MNDLPEATQAEVDAAIPQLENSETTDEDSGQ